MQRKRCLTWIEEWTRFLINVVFICPHTPNKKSVFIEDTLWKSAAQSVKIGGRNLVTALRHLKDLLSGRV